MTVTQLTATGRYDDRADLCRIVFPFNARRGNGTRKPSSGALKGRTARRLTRPESNEYPRRVTAGGGARPRELTLCDNSFGPAQVSP